MTPLKFIWHCWNSYDTAEISQQLFKALSHFKENIEENYFMCKYPHCGERVFPKMTFSRPLPMKMGPLSKKSLGILNWIFSFSGVIDTAETRFLKLLKQLSRWIRSHMQNVFSLLIKDLFGVDWLKNQEFKISWHCPFINTMCENADIVYIFSLNCYKSSVCVE
jgi:hypothetical protein